MPSISVIIPTYNRAYCIGDAIDSILAQDPPADEVIVIDDGSTDNTQELLKAYGDRIIVLRQRNSGAASARNLGLRHAHGDWVTFLDSDDLWLQNRLALLHRDLQEKTALGAVLHVADLHMTGEGNDERLFKLRNWPIDEGNTIFIRDALPRTLSGISLCSSAVRRDVAIRTGGFPINSRIYEDAYFFCMVALSGPALFNGQVVAEARRISRDKSALSSIEKCFPIEAGNARISYIENILSKNLNVQQKKYTETALSGAHFKLAASYQNVDKKEEKNNLIKSVLYHPHKVRGAIKALAAFSFRSYGYNFLLKKRNRFSRS